MHHVSSLKKKKGWEQSFKPSNQKIKDINRLSKDIYEVLNGHDHIPYHSIYIKTDDNLWYPDYIFPSEPKSLHHAGYHKPLGFIGIYASVQ
jgi:hypothetical protein